MARPRETRSDGASLTEPESLRRRSERSRTRSANSGASRMFHVEHVTIGAGEPGFQAGAAPRLARGVAAEGRRPSCRRTGAQPPPRGRTGRVLSAGHRRASGSGGSLTTSRPPSRRKGAPHSATTAGVPNDRATTRSNSARCRGSRAASSAVERTTATRSPKPSSSTASVRNTARRSPASSSTHRDCGHHAARANPGTPPPEPRSSARSGAGTASRNPRACCACRSTSPGPRNPNLCARRHWASTGSILSFRAQPARRAG